MPESVASLAEAKEIHEAVRRIGRERGFPFFELHFDQDSTGDDAVWIYFDVDPSDWSGREGIGRLDSLATSVKDAIFETHIPRIPYVRFRERKVAQAQ
ncbi:MAG: hypothetical protein ACREFD_10655 [Stellaceae bacterium]